MRNLRLNLVDAVYYFDGTMSDRDTNLAQGFFNRYHKDITSFITESKEPLIFCSVIHLALGMSRQLEKRTSDWTQSHPMIHPCGRLCSV